MVTEKVYPEEVTFKLGPVGLIESLICEEIDSGPDGGRPYVKSLRGHMVSEGQCHTGRGPYTSGKLQEMDLCLTENWSAG